jgi:hypothetical protein
VGVTRGVAPTGIWISNDAGQTWYSTQFLFVDYRQIVMDIGTQDAFLAAASTITSTPGAQNLI